MISSVIVTLLRADPFVASRIATYSGVKAVFSDVVPEKCPFPNITVRTMQVSVKAEIKIFNIYIDYWDHNTNASRYGAKVVCNRIENILDGYRLLNDGGEYTDIRFRLLSGYAATAEEYNGVHYNLFFSVRACRRGWLTTTTTTTTTES